MLNQNTKGFLTMLTIAGIITSVFYGYKGLVEPNLMKNAELFPVDIEEITISPKVEIKTDSAVITWDSENSQGGILYSVDKQNCIDKNTKCISENSEVTGKTHTSIIKNLEQGKDYFYKIKIGAEEFPQEKNNFFSFSNPKDPETKEPKKLDPSKMREAIKNQDLQYDLNSDGKVNILDLYLLKSKYSN